MHRQRVKRPLPVSNDTEEAEMTNATAFVVLKSRKRVLSAWNPAHHVFAITVVWQPGQEIFIFPFPLGTL